jgi:hypothetical protein
LVADGHEFHAGDGFKPGDVALPGDAARADKADTDPVVAHHSLPIAARGYYVVRTGL